MSTSMSSSAVVSSSVRLLDLIAELGELAAQALLDKFPGHAAIAPRLSLQPAAKPEFGDLQLAACLQLAKPLSAKPRELAALVQQRLAAHPAISKAEIAGPGYVNLHLASAFIESSLNALRRDPHHGVRQPFVGQSVVIDYSSPNIAKPMHVAHIRSTIIGDALARHMRAVGYRVIADNHLGDWGTQFGKLIVAYRRFLDPAAFKYDPIGELVRLYQKFVSDEKKQADDLAIGKPARHPAAAVEADEEGEEEEDTAAVTPLLQAARAELAKLQRGDEENLKLWREFIAVSVAEFQKTYHRLDVHFDCILGESHYHPRLGSLVQELLDRGIAEPSRGAIICNIEGEASPLLIRKADGSFLYGTSDLATIEHRVNTWHPSRILYVVGAPQQLHFRQVFAVARKLGVTCELEHIMFGTMRFRNDAGQWATGRTSKGNVPLLDEFLDESIRRAQVVASSKNAELSPAEISEVARVVGIGAIKYNDLARDRQSDIHFDLDQALSLEGNTAPYMQYAYARLRSIARRAEAEGATVAESLTLREPAERALGRRLLDFSEAVETVVRTARPHHLCQYLYELAGQVGTFYSEVPVLKAEPEARAARLLLLSLCAGTLRHGLGLLGIEVPERM